LLFCCLKSDDFVLCADAASRSRGGVNDALNLARSMSRDLHAFEVSQQIQECLIMVERENYQSFTCAVLKISALISHNFPETKSEELGSLAMELEKDRKLLLETAVCFLVASFWYCIEKSVKIVIDGLAVCVRGLKNISTVIFALEEGPEANYQKAFVRNIIFDMMLQMKDSVKDYDANWEYIPWCVHWVERVADLLGESEQAEKLNFEGLRFFGYQSEQHISDEAPPHVLLPTFYNNLGLAEEKRSSYAKALEYFGIARRSVALVNDFDSDEDKQNQIAMIQKNETRIVARTAGVHLFICLFCLFVGMSQAYNPDGNSNN